GQPSAALMFQFLCDWRGTASGNTTDTLFQQMATALTNNNWQVSSRNLAQDARTTMKPQRWVLCRVVGRADHWMYHDTAVNGNACSYQLANNTTVNGTVVQEWTTVAAQTAALTAWNNRINQVATAVDNDIWWFMFTSIFGVDNAFLYVAAHGSA